MIIENEAAYNAAIKRNILANANKTWRANTERADEIEDAIVSGRRFDDYGKVIGYTDDFIGSMADAFDKWGKLTPNQSAAILRGIDARAARRAEWKSKQAAIDATREHIGVVGQKIEMTLIVKKVIKIQGASFSYYDSGITYLYILEDANQNVAIYKGKSAAFDDVKEGDAISITATVKEHGVRNGVKQTVLQRPKISA